jgi:hypothetical protein
MESKMNALHYRVFTVNQIKIIDHNFQLLISI